MNSLTKEDAVDGQDQKTMRMDPIAGIDAAAQSQVPTRPTGLTVLVEDLDVYDQSRTTAYSLGSSSGSSNIISPLHFPSSAIQESVVPQQEPVSLTPSQVCSRSASDT